MNSIKCHLNLGDNSKFQTFPQSCLMIRKLREPDWLFFPPSCNNHSGKNICCDFFPAETSIKDIMVIYSIFTPAWFSPCLLLHWLVLKECPISKLYAMQSTNHAANDTAEPGKCCLEVELWFPPFHVLLIKEKWKRILAEQTDNVILSQPAVGLDPNYFTNYPDVGQVT